MAADSPGLLARQRLDCKACVGSSLFPPRTPHQPFPRTAALSCLQLAPAHAAAHPTLGKGIRLQLMPQALAPQVGERVKEAMAAAFKGLASWRSTLPRWCGWTMREPSGCELAPAGAAPTPPRGPAALRALARSSPHGYASPHQHLIRPCAHCPVGAGLITSAFFAAPAALLPAHSLSCLLLLLPIICMQVFMASDGKMAQKQQVGRVEGAMVARQ